MKGYRLCDRVLGHWWRELVPGVRRCRVCRAIEIEAGARARLAGWPP